MTPNCFCCLNRKPTTHSDHLYHGWCSTASIACACTVIWKWFEVSAFLRNVRVCLPDRKCMLTWHCQKGKIPGRTQEHRAVYWPKKCYVCNLLMPPLSPMSQLRWPCVFGLMFLGCLVGVKLLLACEEKQSLSVGCLNHDVWCMCGGAKRVGPPADQQPQRGFLIVSDSEGVPYKNCTLTHKFHPPTFFYWLTLRVSWGARWRRVYGKDKRSTLRVRRVLGFLGRYFLRWKAFLFTR